MKNNERIFDFFERNLTESEKEKLLQEIEKNPSLKIEFETYKKLYGLLEKSGNIKPPEDYLDSIILKFRSKTNKTYVNLKPVFASVLMIFFTLIGIFIYNTLIKNGTNQFDETSNYYEISELQNENLEDMAILLDKDELDELLLSELMENGNKLSLLENYFHIDNNYIILSDKDAEVIYQELITKKIL